MLRRALHVVGLAVGLTIPCLADPPSAQDLLRQAATALSELPAIRYQARGEADGALSLRVPKMDGTVTLVRTPAGENLKLRLDAQVVPPMYTKPVTLQVASDGQQIYLAEHGARVFVRRELPFGNLLLNNVAPLLITELIAPRPFEREVAAVSLQHVGSEKVGDAECDVVHAVFTRGGDEVRWYLGKADRLPRRVERIIQTPLGRSTITTTLTSVDPKPSVDEGQFRLEKPAGFEEPVFAQPNAGGELLPVGADAPDWTLKDWNGNDVSLKSLRGKVVLLDFWATWCGPCRMSMPGLQKLHEKYKDKPVAIFGVNCYERGPVDAAGFIKSGGFTYPQLLNGSEVALAYRVNGIPAYYVIGPDGKVLLAYSGFSADRERQIEVLIEKHLPRPPG